ncbi:MAG TPA: hypothetical protein VJO33_18225, partial [Gemmatimonadaceae bacterium]|nr:hypothetical protein [Gemmatimonadaceae bacterium]
MIKPRDVLTLLLAGSIALGLGGRDGARLGDLTNPLDFATTEIASVAENVASPATAHLGFDTSEYPGDDAMRAWRDDGSYEWVGYYLPAAPCHKDASWSGKRDGLAQ